MPRRMPIQIPSALLLLIAALTAAGCTPKSPEEQVAEARSRYTATLNAFVVQETPVAEAAVDEAEGEVATAEAAAAAVADEEGAGEGEGEEETEPAPPVRQNVLLDLVLQHDLDEALPGITVDVTQVAADKSEKGAWKVWVETAGLPEATQKQVVHTLEEIEYEEGDGFHAEIRSSVPPEERSQYREFGGSSGGG